MHAHSNAIFGATVAIIAATSPTAADSRKWVAVDDLRRYTCPSDECGIVGRFYFRESLPVFETSNGWSRVSTYKTAGCFDGESLFVETGPSGCSAENGITDGEFSEWVKSKFLVSQPPNEPMERSSEDLAEG